MERTKKIKSIKGFTLVELVIVIAVIGILASVLIPVFSNVINNAKKSAKKQQARAIQEEYMSAFLLPPEETIGTLIKIDDTLFIIDNDCSLVEVNADDYGNFDDYLRIEGIPTVKTAQVYRRTNSTVFEITFDALSGSVNGVDKVYTQYYSDKFYSDKELINETELPTAIGDIKGYKTNFIGWLNTNDNDAEFVTNKNATPINSPIFYKGKFVIERNITLYARYDKQATNYSINYNLDGGENNSENITSYNINTPTFELKKPKKEGYTFKGWYSSSDFNTENKVTKIESGSTGDINLYAMFVSGTEANYTVEYYIQDLYTESVYTLYEPATILIGSVDKEVTIEPKEIEGFEFDSDNAENVVKESIKDDGTTKFKLYYNRKVYTISWLINGIRYDTQYKYGAMPNRSNPTKADTEKYSYKFRTWNPSITMVTKDITYEADFEEIAKTYKIEFEENGGNQILDTVYSCGSKMTLPTAVKNGYTFLGWTLSNDTSDKNYITIINEDDFGDKTLYAKYEITIYNISYELDGGTNGANVPIYTIEDLITLKDATKKGYTFKGWYLESAFENKIDNIEKGSIGNKTLYAKFDIQNYKINYLLNGGENGDNPTTYNVETSTIILKDALRQGYDFKGWYLEESFSNKVIIVEKGNIGDLTLYAKFTITTYTINYNLNGGENGDNPSSYTINDIIITLKDATKIGYDFVGWFKDSKFASNSKITSITKDTLNNYTLYAKFTAKDNINYTIEHYLQNLENNSYTLFDENIENCKGSTNSQITVMPKTTFEGFTFDSSNPKNITTANIKYDGSTVLKLYYNRNSYDVTFIVDGKQVTKSYKYGDTLSIEEPKKAETEGYTYTFDGWDTNIEPVSKNITYTAKFIEIPKTFTIIYKENGGTIISNMTYTYGENVTLPKTTKEENVFAGWTNSNDSSDKNYITSISSTDYGDKIFYAKYYPKHNIVYLVNYYGENLNDDNYSIINYTNPKAEYGTTVSAEIKNITGYQINNAKSNISEVIDPEGKTVLNVYYDRIRYTITWVVDNTKTNETYKYGSVLTKANPTKNQDNGYTYTFSSWDSNIENVSSNKTYTAIFSKTARVYSIILNDYNNSLINKLQYTYGQGYSLTNPSEYNYSKRGYSFEGWTKTTNNDDINYVNNVTATDYGDKTFYSKFSIINYTIKYKYYRNYDLNIKEISSVVNENPTTYNVNSDTIEFKTPSKTGYTFIKWYLDESFSNEIKYISANSIGNYQLYGKFDIIKYNISYEYPNTDLRITNDPNSSSYNSTNSTYKIYVKNTNTTRYTIEDNIVLSDPIKMEYWSISNNYRNEKYDNESIDIFRGWYLNSALTDKTSISSYQNISVLSNEVLEIKEGTTGDIVLYGDWYTPILNFGSYKGETLEWEILDIKDNKVFVITGKIIERVYGFVSDPNNYEDYFWDNTKVYKFLNNGEFFKSFTTDEISKIVQSKYTHTYSYYGSDPKYTREEINYFSPYSYNDNLKYSHEFFKINIKGKKLSNYVTNTYSYEKNIFKEYNEYLYIGYYEKYASISGIVDGKPKMSFGTLVTEPAYHFIAPTTYLNILNDTYTIKYELNGGTHSGNPTTYTRNSSTINLKNPTKAGYTFGGWYIDSDYEISVSKIKSGSIGNITLRAKWI